MQTKNSIKKLTQLAILTALVIVLQTFASAIPVGSTKLSLVLIPIVIGAIVLGPACGAFLGFVFGLITVIAGVTATDYFTNVLFVAQPVATVIICILKATLAGFGAGLIYKAVSGKNKFVASVLAAASAPIINTGIFVLGGLFLVNKTIEANLANFGASGQTVIYFVIIGCAGLNFVVEFFANLVFSPAINTIVNAVQGKISKK